MDRLSDLDDDDARKSISNDMIAEYRRMCSFRLIHYFVSINEGGKPDDPPSWPPPTPSSSVAIGKSIHPSRRDRLSGTRNELPQTSDPAPQNSESGNKLTKDLAVESGKKHSELAAETIEIRDSSNGSFTEVAFNIASLQSAVAAGSLTATNNGSKGGETLISCSPPKQTKSKQSEYDSRMKRMEENSERASVNDGATKSASVILQEQSLLKERRKREGASPTPGKKRAKPSSHDKTADVGDGAKKDASVKLKEKSRLEDGKAEKKREAASPTPGKKCGRPTLSHKTVGVSEGTKKDSSVKLKKRGRPKGTKSKDKMEAASETLDEKHAKPTLSHKTVGVGEGTKDGSSVKLKKRGRPKGTKSKDKMETASKTLDKKHAKPMLSKKTVVPQGERNSETKPSPAKKRKKDRIMDESKHQPHSVTRMSFISPKETSVWKSVMKKRTEQWAKPYESIAQQTETILTRPLKFRHRFLEIFEDKLVEQQADTSKLLPKDLIKDVLSKYNTKREKGRVKLQTKKDILHLLDQKCGSYTNKPTSSREYWDACKHRKDFIIPDECPEGLHASKSQFLEYENLAKSVHDKRNHLNKRLGVLEKSKTLRSLTVDAKKIVRNDSSKIDVQTKTHMLQKAEGLKNNATRLIQLLTDTDS